MSGPDFEVALVIEDARWSAALALEALALRCGQAVLERLGLPAASCDLLACDDQRIAALNGAFRGKAQATNVLSWPACDLASDAPGQRPHAPEPGYDGQIALGDIALSFDTCRAEAEAQGLGLERRVAHMIVHGLLHLLGYDHIHDEDAALMEDLEVQILGTLGIDSPY